MIRAYVSVECCDPDGVFVRRVRIRTVAVERTALGVEIVRSARLPTCPSMEPVVRNHCRVKAALPVCLGFRSVGYRFGGIDNQRDAVASCRWLTRRGSCGPLKDDGNLLKLAPRRLIGRLDTKDQVQVCRIGTLAYGLSCDPPSTTHPFLRRYTYRAPSSLKLDDTEPSCSCKPYKLAFPS